MKLMKEKQEEMSNLIKDEFNRNLSLFDINIQAFILQRRELNLQWKI